MGLCVKDGGCGAELAADGQQHQGFVEDQLQEQRHPEGGQGHGADREKAHRVVQQPVFLLGGINAQRDADDDGQCKGQQHQLQRGGHILGQFLGHRQLGAVIGAQVSVEQVSQIVHILDGKRVIQSQFLRGGGQLLRGGSGAHPFGGRVGGKDVGDEKCDGHHAPQDQDAAQQPLHNVFCHRFYPRSV